MKYSNNNISICFGYLAGFLVFTAAGCTSVKQTHYTFNQKYPADALRKDLVILKNVLEANHPSLYWYTPKDSIDYYFDQSLNSITDSLTEVQFHNKVAGAVSKIRCGHTSVRFSNQYNKQYDKNKYPMFPLFIKTWGDSMVVLKNLLPKDTVLKQGTIITSINGKGNKWILDSIFQFISTDGYSENYKSQIASFNFPAWYKIVFGLDSSYRIQYIDSMGKEAVTVIKNFELKKESIPKKDSLNKRIIVPDAGKMPPLTRKQKRQIRSQSKESMQIDTAISTAYIRLTTFGNRKLRSFFRNSFRTIHQQHLQNLVIDLRENGGGDVQKSVLLSKYLVDTAFKVGDTVAAVSRSFKYGRYIHSSFWYWFPMNLVSRKMSDGRIHQRRMETHYFQPKTKNHFNGTIYLVQGGFTFSAATMFISGLKGQPNVKVVGEETGGGYYGNSAMYLLTVILPNSHIRVGLPMYRLVMKAGRIKNGKGILPDIEIAPSSQAIRKNIDPKLSAIREMIQSGKK
jgi:C-terminal processing protease CtpA/Prc